MNILFVCVGNQGRSLMAERLLRARTTEHEARSAGAAPGRAPHPEVVAVLAELGIDASDHVPTLLDPQLLDWADVVVATCDGVCPATPGKQRFEWGVADPRDKPLEEVRSIRDEVADRVDRLVAELSVG